MGKKPSLNISRCKIQYVFMVLMHLCLAKSQAQMHTFVHTYRNWGGFDIAEDYKNGYLFFAGFNSVRIDKYGNKLWTKQFDSERMFHTERDSNCFFQFGVGSEVGGLAFNKIDYKGNILEENFIIAQDKKDTQLTPKDVIYDANRDQFIVCGVKNKYLANKFQFWIAGLDKHGKIVWQNSWFDKGQSKYFKRILPNKATGGYLLLGNSFEDDDYSEIFTTDSYGKLKTRSIIDSCFDVVSWIYNMQVFDIQPYRDSFFLLSVYRADCNRDIAYYVLNKHGKTVRKIVTENVSPLFLPLKNGNVLGAGGAGLIMLDTNFNVIWIREKIFGEHPDYGYEMRKIYQSREGGFYGICEGLKYNVHDNETSLVFVFKTDSLGNIYNREKYSEWDKSMMLIPNLRPKMCALPFPIITAELKQNFTICRGSLFLKNPATTQSHLIFPPYLRVCTW